MIKLNKPTFCQEDIFNDCTINIAKGDRRNRIIACKQHIIDKSSEYDIIAEAGLLSAIEADDSVNGVASNEDMKFLYGSKFVADGGREYYDKLLKIPTNGICPYCGHRIVNTLDHYLPKMKYPTYAITIYNLIPACIDCNKLKLDQILTGRKSECINPYYDNFDNEIWLKAEVIQKEPIAFNYYVDNPHEWDEIMYERVVFHFKLFKLRILYIAHAAEEYSEIYYLLIDKYKLGGSDLVKKYLLTEIKSRERNKKNTWKIALYRALYESEWFVSVHLAKQAL